MRKKLFGLFLILVFLLSGCSGIIDSLQQEISNARRPDAPLAELPYIDENIETSFEPQVLDFYYQQLQEPEEQKIYRAYLQFLIDADKESVYLKGTYTREQVSAAMYALQYDYPQFLTRGWRYQCTYYSTASGKVIGIELAPGEEDYDYSSAREQLYQELSEILFLAQEYSDPWERQLFLYDLLIDRVTYDRNTSAELLQEGSPGQQLSHTAYGALATGKAVCDGYTYAFQLLCSYAGIPATTVIGTAQVENTAADNGQENHAWNLVRIGNEYYYCDPTWDDTGDQYLDSDGTFITAPQSTEGLRQILPTVTHQYFNLSYTTIAQNHQFSTYFAYPERTGTPQDYYSRKGLVPASRGELERLISAACQNLSQGDVGIEFRFGYSMSDPAQEVFDRMRLIGIHSTAVVSSPQAEDLGCLVFVYR